MASARVFDTSLNEEGIIGRAVGMALAGLMPVPEIQFRKYAEPATEQINDCGTMRWRTANRFAAPMVLRMPGGFFKCGDPWHSQTNEVQFVHNPGMEGGGAVQCRGCGRAASGELARARPGDVLRASRDARRQLGAAAVAGRCVMCCRSGGRRRPARATRSRSSPGARWCRAARRRRRAFRADVIDLRTLMPWDREMVLESVRRTRRCLIVHEDLRTGGFGAEIAAVVADEAFLDLDAPVARVTMPDIPSPHHPDCWRRRCLGRARSAPRSTGWWGSR